MAREKEKAVPVRLPVTAVIDGKDRKPGEVIDLPESEAKAMLARYGEYKGPPVSAAEKPAPVKPKGEKLTAAIVAAVKDLDDENDDHFTRSGLPVLAELEKRLGYDVTAEERDIAWASLQAGQTNMI
ncbi:hypothetical protein H2509_20530 [Stappia sp. F7233]|uniref:Uncharacterized protein n=1 Tax=Stappia albiluteola TaxID=2758565 RepID=A0A839AKI6_9HYPH|nr:hypothetical protein [Stappia albiluteola]MBA5779524.1 hypothetical protein [Stappia albiluteola]